MAITTAFEIKPKRICPEVVTTRAYFSGEEIVIKLLLVLFIFQLIMKYVRVPHMRLTYSMLLEDRLSFSLFKYYTFSFTSCSQAVR